MRLVAFRSYYWEADGYWAGIPAGWVALPAVTPQVLYRTGGEATFGPSQVGEVTIPVEFGYRGALGYEAAWHRLLGKLQLVNLAPGELVAVRNTGETVKVPALPAVPAQAGGDVPTLVLSFVATQVAWTGVGTVGVTGAV